jgi:hypothetical protein
MAFRELPEDLVNHVARQAVEGAFSKDRGVHEGLAFSFDWNGKQWSTVVDLQERWVKILGKDEMAAAVKEAAEKN